MDRLEIERAVREIGERLRILGQELRNLRYGVDMARRGWLRASDVLGTRSVEEFREAVRRT